jgi:hypothetical protein
MRRAVVALLLAPLVAACTQGAKSGRRLELPPVPDPLPMTVTEAQAPLPALPSGPERIEGTGSIRVVWEALAVERDRFTNPRYQGTKVFATPEDLELILVNASFVATPEQEAENKSRPPSGRIARIADADMLGLLEALNQIGFFQVAQSTASSRALFGSDRARGRITVEKDGQSWTIVSMRGLGLQAETRNIPGIYALAKEAISHVKNASPTLRVKGGSIGDRDPTRYKEGGTPSGSTSTGSGGSSGSGSSDK